MTYDRSTIYPVILSRIAEGESLRTICKTDGLPHIDTVMTWLDDDAAFSEQYTRAHKAQAAWHIERGIEIVSERPPDVGDTNHKAGGSRMDSAFVAWQKVRWDAHRWYASKLDPKRYADKIDHTLAAPDGGPVQNTVRVLFGRD